MSFNAPNYLITKVVLQSEFAKELGDEPTSEAIAETVETEIDRYAILSGFLSGTWGLLMPFVVKDQIQDAIDHPKPGNPAQQQQSVPGGG